MKKITEKRLCLIPLAVWFVVIPLIVKEKSYANPLIQYPWYSPNNTLTDFFLYYKSLFVTAAGIAMLGILFWQIGKMRNKDILANRDTRILIPLLIYVSFVVLSSLISDYSYFCTHGMPDQFETVWNLISYVIALFYCYYVVVYQHSEKDIIFFAFIGAAFVGIICVLQYFKIDIYRMIYAKEGYTFTFELGTVYGPFYNTNYVGYYSLLFVPLFVMFSICYKDLKTRIISAVLACALLISMAGADSITAGYAMLGVAIFGILFILLKNVGKRKKIWILIIAVVGVVFVTCLIMTPRFAAYLQATDTEKTDLENIFTHDDNVEIDYKGQKIFIQMMQQEDLITFDLKDQNLIDISYQYMTSDDFYYYEVLDERFDKMTLIPAILNSDPVKYGFIVNIGEKDKNWCFTNQLTDDGTYYYYNDMGKLTKLTAENISPDFAPLVKYSYFASGRGYIWNKTLAILKEYLLLGSGADTYAMIYPNEDYVDKYNNGYGGLIVTKPHSLYLQIATQTGVLSLLCLLIFYLWYFVSSMRIYFKNRLDNILAISGFSIMLGTLGYMISALANDSTITISPLYWALLGVGIGINSRLKISK